MYIDVTKLITNQVDSLDINEELTIPKDYLKDTDIRDISPVKVEGSIVFDGVTFTLDANIKCTLLLTCSVSLEDVNYEIDTNISEEISYEGENFDKIINNSIDFLSIIWQNIIVEVPIRVVSPSLKEKNIVGDGWKFITEEEENNEIDPRLEKLKDFLSE